MPEIKPPALISVELYRYIRDCIYRGKIVAVDEVEYGRFNVVCYPNTTDVKMLCKKHRNVITQPPEDYQTTACQIAGII